MKWLIVLIGALAGFGLGAWSRSWRAGERFATDLAPQAPGASSLARAGAPTPLALVLAGLRKGGDLDALADLGENLSHLTAEQMAAVIARLERESGDPSDYRPGWLAMWWLTHDPQAASAWIAGRLRKDAGNPLLSSMATPRWPMTEAWALAFPKEALALAREFPSSALAGSVLFVLRGGRKPLPPAESWQLIRDFPEGPGRVREAARVITAWAAKDPLAALAAAEGLEPGKTRAEAMTAALPGVAKKDAALAFAKYQELGLADLGLVAKLAAATATQDPEGTAAWLLEFEEGPFRAVAPSFVQAWAAKNPAAALAWAQEHNAWADSAYLSVMTYYHDGFRHGASHGVEFAADIVGAAMRADPQATIAWATSLPPGPERNRALLDSLYAAKSEDALALFAQLPSESQPSVVGTVMGKLDPKNAPQWAGNLPPGKVRENAWRALGQTENAVSPPEAGVDRDAFLAGSMYRGMINDRSPEKSLQIVLEIQDPAKRRAEFDRAMSYYEDDFKTSQQKTALTWLETAPLPEEWKTKWRKK